MIVLLIPWLVDALRCWRCSSDISNGDFCKDPFNPSLMSEYQRKWSYVDCVLPVSQLNPLILNKARPVCKKIIQQGEWEERKVNGKFYLYFLGYHFSAREIGLCPCLLLGNRRGCPGHLQIRSYSSRCEDYFLWDLQIRRLQRRPDENHLDLRSLRDNGSSGFRIDQQFGGQ